MNHRLMRFLIVLPILLHLNVFDFLHPAHNFGRMDNCPVCQIHTYQNNIDTEETVLKRPVLALLTITKDAGEYLIPADPASNANPIRGPPQI